MATNAQIEAQNLYANLLTEIKFRVDAINHCTAGRSGLAPPFVKDFCYLQIRMICELVALGCLVVHGDITKKQTLKEWSAERIMETLGKIHPHFYPIPIKQEPKAYPDGRRGFELRAIHSPLPREAFLQLYGKCGDMLHRGNIRKILKGQLPVQINFPDIVGKAQPIIDLLSNHVMVLKSGEEMFLCMLANAQDNNQVQVAIAETPAGGRIDYESPQFLREVGEALRGPHA